MILNYLKLAFRLLFRNPFFTCINVLGLSVGFAAFYILWPYTQSELRADQFHKDYDRIALLAWHNRWTDDNQNWNDFHLVGNYCGVGKRIADKFSEVEDLTRLVHQKGTKKTLGGVDPNIFFVFYKSDSTKKYFHEDDAAYADPNFFQFFSFPLLSGHPAKVLSKPYSVCISRKLGNKYFGTTNPVNATIYLNDSIPLTVTGVFEDLPQNTHFRFELIITTAGIDDFDLYSGSSALGPKHWMGLNYIKVSKGTLFDDVQKKVDSRRKELYDSRENADADPTTLVQPLKEVAFSDFVGNTLVYKSKNALTILSALSFIILFLAWTNYISLSITTLHKRLPEVGTRKVIGAQNRDFVAQFFIESALINLASVLVALTLIQLLRTPIEYLFHFYIPDWQTYHTIFTLIIPPVFGIFITGFYPVLVSAKKGVADLLKRLRKVQIPWWINSLVTVQYASAVVLLIWVGTIYFQLDYILNKNTGVNRAGILVVDVPLNRSENSFRQLDYFIQESLRTNKKLKASLSNSVTGDEPGIPTFVQLNKNSVVVGLHTNGGVDENFLDLYGIPLLEGRNFQADRPSDKKGILISRMAATRLGFSSPKECIAAKVILPIYGVSDAEIIGVYEDYSFVPYFVGVQQLGFGSILTYKNSLAPDMPPSKVSFKVDLRQAKSTITRLEELYRSSFPQDAFKWSFLDQNIQRHYAQEQINRNQIMLFTLLAIGITCLGLLGTTSNKVIAKTKEIGIRKVLGAGMYQIAQTIISTTSRQVIVANMVGIPIAYYLVEAYLERYSERIGFQWWHYALPVALLLLIMFVTIAGVLIKATRTNPVESLRSE